ncbi:hypothetical protein BAUCODRAFT_150665 [Baudoinia panamericana UAMH 10762]|uniref:Uncharacterized protein n=1 Tax=Baudoinia panamericana (strain UAMH 10762) TaxID=717646 RepID=M2LGT4_BAUPA|nr:uncharacterized protein BAUCODRAFT_150665 [Baudoinia panamericana UAMH 10762]EMC93317.1 hypothetical protein BAUCODRAFT_150665 [Baudoinia panamericana UAMH 10762]
MVSVSVPVGIMEVGAVSEVVEVLVIAGTRVTDVVWVEFAVTNSSLVDEASLVGTVIVAELEPTGTTVTETDVESSEVDDPLDVTELVTSGITLIDADVDNAEVDDPLDVAELETSGTTVTDAEVEDSEAGTAVEVVAVPAVISAVALDPVEVVSVDTIAVSEVVRLDGLVALLSVEVTDVPDIVPLGALDVAVSVVDGTVAVGTLPVLTAVLSVVNWTLPDTVMLDTEAVRLGSTLAETLKVVDGTVVGIVAAARADDSDADTEAWTADCEDEIEARTEASEARIDDASVVTGTGTRTVVEDPVLVLVVNRGAGLITDPAVSEAEPVEVLIGGLEELAPVLAIELTVADRSVAVEAEMETDAEAVSDAVGTLVTTLTGTELVGLAETVSGPDEVTTLPVSAVRDVELPDTARTLEVLTLAIPVADSVAVLVELTAASEPEKVPEALVATPEGLSEVSLVTTATLAGVGLADATLAVSEDVEELVIGTAVVPNAVVSAGSVDPVALGSVPLLIMTDVAVSVGGAVSVVVVPVTVGTLDRETVTVASEVPVAEASLDRGAGSVLAALLVDGITVVVTERAIESVAVVPVASVVSVTEAWLDATVSVTDTPLTSETLAMREPVATPDAPALAVPELLIVVLAAVPFVAAAVGGADWSVVAPRVALSTVVVVNVTETSAPLSVELTAAVVSLGAVEDSTAVSAAAVAKEVAVVSLGAVEESAAVSAVVVAEDAAVGSLDADDVATVVSGATVTEDAAVGSLDADDVATVDSGAPVTEDAAVASLDEDDVATVVSAAAVTEDAMVVPLAVEDEPTVISAAADDEDDAADKTVLLLLSVAAAVVINETDVEPVAVLVMVIVVLPVNAIVVVRDAADAVFAMEDTESELVSVELTSTTVEISAEDDAVDDNTVSTPTVTAPVYELVDVVESIADVLVVMSVIEAELDGWTLSDTLPAETPLKLAEAASPLIAARLEDVEVASAVDELDDKVNGASERLAATDDTSEETPLMELAIVDVVGTELVGETVLLADVEADPLLIVGDTMEDGTLLPDATVPTLRLAVVASVELEVNAPRSEDAEPLLAGEPDTAAVLLEDAELALDVNDAGSDELAPEVGPGMEEVVLELEARLEVEAKLLDVVLLADDTAVTTAELVLDPTKGARRPFRKPVEEAVELETATLEDDTGVEKLLVLGAGPKLLGLKLDGAAMDELENSTLFDVVSAAEELVGEMVSV